jgi:hypothetical protein
MASSASLILQRGDMFAVSNSGGPVSRTPVVQTGGRAPRGASPRARRTGADVGTPPRAPKPSVPPRRFITSAEQILELCGQISADGEGPPAAIEEFLTLCGEEGVVEFMGPEQKAMVVVRLQGIKARRGNL